MFALYGLAGIRHWSRTLEIQKTFLNSKSEYYRSNRTISQTNLKVKINVHKSQEEIIFQYYTVTKFYKFKYIKVEIINVFTAFNFQVQNVHISTHLTIEYIQVQMNVWLSWPLVVVSRQKLFALQLHRFEEVSHLVQPITKHRKI